MVQLKNTSVLYLIFAQISGISTNATTPTSIIENGVSNKTILNAFIKAGTTISMYVK